PSPAARRAPPATPPAFRSCAASSRYLLVFVVTAPPVRGSFLVTTERRQVEHPVGAHELLDSTVVGGVSVVHDPVLEREGAHPLSLRPGGLVDVAEVVFGTVPLLLLREGGTEVVLEIAAEG